MLFCERLTELSGLYSKNGFDCDKFANTTTEPAIVKFAFTNLTVVGSSDKWTAISVD